MSLNSNKTTMFAIWDNFHEEDAEIKGLRKECNMETERHGTDYSRIIFHNGYLLPSSAVIFRGLEWVGRINQPRFAKVIKKRLECDITSPNYHLSCILRGTLRLLEYSTYTNWENPLGQEIETKHDSIRVTPAFMSLACKECKEFFGSIIHDRKRCCIWLRDNYDEHKLNIQRTLYSLLRTLPYYLCVPFDILGVSDLLSVVIESGVVPRDYLRFLELENGYLMHESLYEEGEEHAIKRVCRPRGTMFDIRMYDKEMAKRRYVHQYLEKCLCAGNGPSTIVVSFL